MTVRPETLDFVRRAPLRAAHERVVDATPQALWAALADTESWPHWFPGMNDAIWLSSPPHQVCSRREVSVRFSGSVVEEFLVWDEGERFAFTLVDSTGPPLLRAGAEEVTLTPVDGGTRVRYAVGFEPAVPVGPLGVLTRPGLTLLLRRVTAGLARHVGAG